MWTGMKNNSNSVTSSGNSSKMVDPDLTWQLLQQRNGSEENMPVSSKREFAATNTAHHELPKAGSTAAAACPSCTEESLTRTSGIIPGAIAATVFITFLLALYAVLWKCMVSPPQRKHSKVLLDLNGAD